MPEIVFLPPRHRSTMTDETQEKAREHLRLAMKVTGLTSTELARAADVAPSTLNRFLNQDVKHTISLQTLAKVDAAVEKHLQALPDAVESIRLLLLYSGGGQVEPIQSDTITIQVRGEVNAGHWTEAMEWPEEDWRPVTLPRPDGHRSYFGLRVRGPSMNLIYPDGTILVCVPMLDYDHDLDQEDHVIVQQWRGGFVEATVKELRRDANGIIWLWPRSDHPEHQTPIRLPSNGSDPTEYQGDEEIRIVAVVVADYRVRKPRAG